MQQGRGAAPAAASGVVGRGRRRGGAARPPHAPGKRRGRHARAPSPGHCRPRSEPPPNVAAPGAMAPPAAVAAAAVAGEKL